MTWVTDVTYYSKCPKCGGMVDNGSGWPKDGDDYQYCVGYRENWGPEYDDANAQDNGCGWYNVYESHECPSGATRSAMGLLDGKSTSEQEGAEPLLVDEEDDVLELTHWRPCGECQNDE